MSNWRFFPGFSALRALGTGYSQIIESGRPGRQIALVFAGLLLGWWIYVPCHELLHAAGCWLGGGEVLDLQVSSLYGGRLLAGLFPFVSAGGDYAGRLVGFDTKGSDWTYSLTILMPFVLGFPGFWLTGVSLRKSQAIAYGFGLPVSLSPLLSATGDFFEFSGLVLYQVWPGAQDAHRALISDDLFRLLGELSHASPGWRGVTFVILAQAIALVLALFVVTVTSLAGRFGKME